MGLLKQKKRPFEFVIVKRSPAFLKFGGITKQLSDLTLELDDSGDDEYLTHYEDGVKNNVNYVDKSRNDMKPVKFSRDKIKENFKRNGRWFSSVSESTQETYTSASTSLHSKLSPHSERINELRSKLRSLEVKYRRKKLLRDLKQSKSQNEVNPLPRYGLTSDQGIHAKSVTVKQNMMKSRREISCARLTLNLRSLQRSHYHDHTKK